jgi:antitoxin HicB
MLAYIVTLEPDDNDTLLVTCPALPEVTTFGESEEDALRDTVGAIEKAIAGRISYGERLPPTVLAAEKVLGRNARFLKLPAITVLKTQP